MKKIITVTVSFLMIINTAHTQDYKNAQLGLPDLNQVAPVVKSATDALPFIGFSAANTFADTLSYFLSIANTGFKPVEKNISDKHYLQAGNIYGPDLNATDRVVSLRFQFRDISFKKSATAQYAYDQVADFAKKLAATDTSYKITQSKNKDGAASTLWLGKVPILSWYIDLQKHGVPYPIFQIAITSAPFDQLADETSYKGKFPTEVLNLSQPQIWEIRGRGKTSDSYQRFNGIFKDGYLVSGTKTFHGYGKFYDGTWMSDEWPNPIFYKRYYVTFMPEASRDTIFGTFWHGAMGEFEMDNYSHYSAASTGWVKDTYIPYKANFDQLRAAKAERNAAGSSSTQYQNNSNSTTNNSSGSGRTYASSFSKCSVCNGKGYTEYDCGQGGGHPCRKYCSACNGTGQVHN